MEVRPVDPLDTDVEVDSPIYRVSFWEHLSFDGVPPEVAGYRCAEYELTDAADVQEVLAWAEANRGERTVEVHIVLNGSLIRLCGQAPTVPS